MKTGILSSGNIRAIYIQSDSPVVNEPGDALDLISLCGERGVYRIILGEECFAPGFFELRTGLAGEVLQKFTQYDIHVAIIGDFSAVTSNSLRDFIRESNRLGRILFSSSADEALARWNSTL